MNKKIFLKMLRSHDWYYSYSDDHRSWKQGQQSWKIINLVLKENPSYRILLDQYIEKRGI